MKGKFVQKKSFNLIFKMKMNCVCVVMKSKLKQNIHSVTKPHPAPPPMKFLKTHLSDAALDVGLGERVGLLLLSC